MLEEIEDIFQHFLTQYDSVDIAEFEFKKAIHEDADLKEMYKNWCHMQGSSEKNGFRDFCQDYIESRNDVWNTLKDYDE
ncbi:MAG: hypothetical protein K2M94_03645 [Paramuribaculum sp.]|nr:hypothetical protein [Paramuribaculum sp.]